MLADNYRSTIDLGSNTFQLLIVSPSHQILQSQSFPVKLLFDQKKTGWIAPEAIERAQKAAYEMLKIIQHYPISQLHCAATSALRTAKNGSEVAEMIFNILKNNTIINQKHEIITGKMEAYYIHAAQNRYLESNSKPYIIIDIGGGSVELIYQQGGKLRLKSLPLGVARILKKFKIDFEKPLSAAIISEINTYLTQKLDFIRDIHPLSPNLGFTLIGIGGAFETNSLLLGHEVENSDVIAINIQDFETLHLQLLKTNAAERQKNKNIPEIRKDMLLLANIITQVVLQLNIFDEIRYSKYDLKYGLWCEMDLF